MLLFWGAILSHLTRVVTAVVGMIELWVCVENGRVFHRFHIIDVELTVGFQRHANIAREVLLNCGA